MSTELQLELSSRRGRLVLATAGLASGMALLDATVVNVALPALAEDLDATVGGVQGVVTAYLVTLAALILVGGTLGDRLGRARVLRFGVVGFTLASLLCAVAPTLQLLVIARLLQGAAAAAMTPSSLAILEATIVPGDRARAIGAWSGLTALAAAAGPLVGGLLVDGPGWRTVFALNVPVGLLTLAISRAVPANKDDAPPPYDVVGAVSGVTALGAGTFSLIVVGERGWSPLTVAAATIAGVALVVFVQDQRRAAAPMLPRAVLALPVFRAVTLLTFAAYAALGVAFFLALIHLQVSLGYGATKAAAALLPTTLLLIALSSRSGQLAGRIGPRLQLTAGPLLIALGLLLFARVQPGVAYATHILPASIVFGVGLATMVAPITSTALAVVPDRLAGLASGINNAVARTAQLLAVATVPVVAGLSGDDLADPTALTAGFRRAMFVTSVVAVLAAVVAWRGIPAGPLSDGPAGPRSDGPAGPLSNGPAGPMSSADDDDV